MFKKTLLIIAGAVTLAAPAAALARPMADFDSLSIPTRVENHSIIQDIETIYPYVTPNNVVYPAGSMTVIRTINLKNDQRFCKIYRQYFSQSDDSKCTYSAPWF